MGARQHACSGCDAAHTVQASAVRSPAALQCVLPQHIRHNSLRMHPPGFRHIQRACIRSVQDRRSGFCITRILNARDAMNLIASRPLLSGLLLLSSAFCLDTSDTTPCACIHQDSGTCKGLQQTGGRQSEGY